MKMKMKQKTRWMEETKEKSSMSASMLPNLEP